MYPIIFSRPAKRDLKRLPVKAIDLLEKEIIPQIQTNPYIGEILRGPFRQFFKYKFSCLGTSYRIAYYIYQKKIIFVVMVDTRENFYQELKRRI